MSTMSSCIQWGQETIMATGFRATNQPPVPAGQTLTLSISYKLVLGCCPPALVLSLAASATLRALAFLKHVVTVLNGA